MYLNTGVTRERKTHFSPDLFYVRFSWWLSGKEFTCNAGDKGLILGSGRSPGEGNGNPLQYSCLGNPMDSGAWWATVCGVTRVRNYLATKQKWMRSLYNWAVLQSHKIVIIKASPNPKVRTSRAKAWTGIMSQRQRAKTNDEYVHKWLTCLLVCSGMYYLLIIPHSLFFLLTELENFFPPHSPYPLKPAIPPPKDEFKFNIHILIRKGKKWSFIFIFPLNSLTIRLEETAVGIGASSSIICSF